jgi:hypothetical protein
MDFAKSTFCYCKRCNKKDLGVLVRINEEALKKVKGEEIQSKIVGPL